MSVEMVYLREHHLEIGRVFGAASEADGRLVLRHGTAVDPHELNPLSIRRIEKGLDGFELLAIRVRLRRFHPTMRDG